LESRGIATATIVTAGFVQAAEAHRRLLKHPDMAYFVVPHPIVSMNDAALAASADAIFEAVVQAVGRGLR
jgi:hypothetical protein